MYLCARYAAADRGSRSGTRTPEAEAICLHGATCAQKWRSKYAAAALYIASAEAVLITPLACHLPKGHTACPDTCVEAVMLQLCSPAGICAGWQECKPCDVRACAQLEACSMTRLRGTGTHTCERRFSRVQSLRGRVELVPGSWVSCSWRVAAHHSRTLRHLSSKSPVRAQHGHIYT